MRGGGISTAVQASDKADSTTNRRYVGKLDSIQKINEVIIVGTPVIPKYREVIPAQVLKEVDLQRLNSLSVADAIRYFAGVQLKDYGGVGGLKTVNIRSMGTNHMAVFYDGIQLGNAQNGQVDLGRFSLDDVEEISLYSDIVITVTIFQDGRIGFHPVGQGFRGLGNHLHHYAAPPLRGGQAGQFQGHDEDRLVRAHQSLDALRV